MNRSRFDNPLWVWVWALASVFCLCRSAAFAQGPLGVGVRAYPGLSITGLVGRVYTVQYTTNLGQPDGWRAAGVVLLPSSPYLWFDATAPANGHRFYRAIASGITNMSWIPPGTFTMGSPATEAQRLEWEGPQTVVTLSRGFFMGRFEVTQGEYLSVMGSNPSHFRNGTPVWPEGSGGVVTNELWHPVEQVTWFDATNYCGRLTTRELQAGRLPEGWAYRLPTEAEWEYGCRAGTVTAFHYGTGLYSGMANFDGREEYESSLGTILSSRGFYIGRTVEVGRYDANLWGLCDMHGNVCEWCSDWWSDSLPGGNVTDPEVTTPSFWRVIRGGGGRGDGAFARSANRTRFVPSSSGDDFGFRVVLSPVH